MSEISIRRAAENDAEDIAAVHIASWQAGYRGIISDQFLDTMRLEDWTNMWTLGLQTARDNNHDNWVAEIAGQVVGFGVVGPPEDDDKDTDQAREVRLLYVMPSHWSQGVGRALLQHMTDDLHQRGFVEVTLSVIATNTRARRFYERLGWQREGWGKPFFVENVPQVRYHLSLT